MQLGASETAQLDMAMRLPELLRSRQDDIARMRSALREQHERVQKLVQDINEVLTTFGLEMTMHALSPVPGADTPTTGV